MEARVTEYMQQLLFFFLVLFYFTFSYHSGGGSGRTPDQGEGFIGIHRGVHGVWNNSASDLDPSIYDWRNPMLQVQVVDLKTLCG